MGKKKVKPGIVEADPNAFSILVHYTEVITEDDGYVSSNNKVKSVKVPGLDASTDITSFAEKVIADCKYIPSSRLAQVEQALMSLQSRAIVAPSRSTRRAEEMGNTANREPASMNKIDEYLELMYEEGKGKVSGTANILELASSVENLELLIQNQSLMALLSRLLDTEYKANLEMCYNIVRTFAAFSNFIEMHPLLATYKAGALTMKVLSHETSRVTLRERDLSQLMDEERRIQTGAVDNGVDRETALRAFQSKKSKTMSKTAKLKKWSEKVMTACYVLLTNLAEDLSIERKMLKKGLLDSLVNHLSTTSSVRLLNTIVNFIWKLAVMRENVTRLHEMRVVSALSAFLPATATQDGSTFPAEELTTSVLKLLICLSFDKLHRESMVKEGFVPRLVDMLRDYAKHRGLVFKLLYHLSVEDRTKVLFTFTDAIPIIMQMIINFPGEKLGRELAALAINLSWHPRVADSMCHFPKKNQGLMELVERMENRKDALLMKIIRNLSSWTYDIQMNMSSEAFEKGQYEQKGLWSRFVDPLLKLLKQEQGERDEDVMVEIVGTLNNLTVYDLPRTSKEPVPLWSTFVRKYDLVSFISKYMVPEMAQLDVVLEVVIFTGQILTDETVAPMIAASNVPKSLFELWQDKAASDSELKVQILFTFFRMLSHKATREELMYGTRACTEILASCDDQHPYIRATSLRCLDIIIESDRDETGRLGQLGIQVCKKRFEAHNKEWIEANHVGYEPKTAPYGYFNSNHLGSPESQDDSFDYDAKHDYDESKDSNEWSAEQKFAGHAESKYSGAEHKGVW